MSITINIKYNAGYVLVQWFSKLIIDFLKYIIRRVFAPMSCSITYIASMITRIMDPKETTTCMYIVSIAHSSIWSLQFELKKLGYSLSPLCYIENNRRFWGAEGHVYLELYSPLRFHCKQQYLGWKNTAIYIKSMEDLFITDTEKIENPSLEWHIYGPNDKLGKPSYERMVKIEILP